jgi:hypothetical protein
LIALSNVAEQFMNDLLGVFGLELTSIQLFSISSWPKPLALLTFFVVSDFLQWNVHRLLHTVPFLWKIHKHIIVSKKWVLQLILDTTGWNLLFTNQFFTFLSY